MVPYKNKSVNSTLSILHNNGLEIKNILTHFIWSDGYHILVNLYFNK